MQVDGNSTFNDTVNVVNTNLTITGDGTTTGLTNL